MNWLKKLFTRTPKPKKYVNYDVGYLEASVEDNDGKKYIFKFTGNLSLGCTKNLTYFYYQVNTAWNQFDKWIDNMPTFIKVDGEYIQSSSIKKIKITKKESKIETVEALA